MINERPISKVSDSMRGDFKRCWMDIDRYVQQVKSATNGERLQIQAFNGGGRDFDSVAAIKRLYAESKTEAKASGMNAMQRFLAELDSTLAVYFHLDASAIEATQTKLNLGSLSESDIQRIANSGRDDYSVLSVIASYGLNNDSPYAKTLHARLRDFEVEAATVKEKAEKFITKALNEDAYCMDGWCDWISGRIDNVDAAYRELQDAVDGHGSFTASDALASR